MAGHVAKHLGDAFAHITQIGAAAALADIGWSVNDIATRELGRQLATLLLFGLRVFGRLCLGILDFRLRRLRLGRDRFGLRRLGLLQRQFELFEGAVDAFGTRAELFATELGDLRLELLDRQLRDDEAILGGDEFSILGE